MKVTIFRIVQEAMNNAAKYANSTNIVVELNHANSELKLSIRDNGCGFDISSLVNELDNNNWMKCSFGLGSMYERAESTNGKFSIESSPGNGTTV